jgi:aminoglycoside phosphotransferase (APT) family kinase protein
MSLEQLKSRLATYYARLSPELPPPSLLTLSPLAGGWASSVYLFTLEHSEYGDSAPTPLVLKTYAPTEGGAEKATREWQALTHLGAIGYPVPPIKLLEADSAYLGAPFIVMEQVPGRSLWHVREQATPHEQDRLTELFVRGLVALHAIDPRVLEPARALPTPYEPIEHELAGLRSATRVSKHQSLAGVVDWLERGKQQVPCSQPAIIHRDYHPWNMLIEPDGQWTVIDWDWTIGDRRFDVAWTLTLMQRSGFEDFSRDVGRVYAIQSGSVLQQMDYFEVLTSLRWLLNVTHALQTGENMRSDANSAFQEFLAAPVRKTVRLLRERTGLPVEVEL